MKLGSDDGVSGLPGRGGTRVYEGRSTGNRSVWGSDDPAPPRAAPRLQPQAQQPVAPSPAVARAVPEQRRANFSEACVGKSPSSLVCLLFSRFTPAVVFAHVCTLIYKFRGLDTSMYFC